MEVMEYLIYIAFISGSIISLVRLTYKLKVEEILVIIGCFKYRKRLVFDVMYEIIDSEPMCRYFYAATNEPKIKKYSSYSKILDKAEPVMYERFMYYQNEFTKDFMWRILPTILLPSVLFLSFWYYYLFGAILAAIIVPTHRIVFKERTFEGSYYLIMGMCIKDFIKDKIQ